MYKRNKFSFRYRIEKWFYEDSKKDAKNLLIAFRDFLLLVAVLIVVFFAHAFFH